MTTPQEALRLAELLRDDPLSMTHEDDLALTAAMSEYSALLERQAQEPFGYVTVQRLSRQFENHADKYWFYPAGCSPYLDNVDECYVVYAAPAPALPALTEEKMHGNDMAVRQAITNSCYVAIFQHQCRRERGE